jgi:HlyD family secretion protein
LKEGILSFALTWGFFALLIKEGIHKILNIRALILLLIVGFGGYFFWTHPHRSSSGYLGYVEGEYVRVASPIAGALTSLPIKRGMQISTGDPLFILEHVNEIASRDEAERRLEKAAYDLQNIQVGKRPEEIEVIEDLLDQAEADQEFALLTLKRQEQLVITKSTSIENLDRARALYNRGQARILELKAQLKVAKLPGRDMEIKAAEKAVEAADNLLQQAQWRVDQKFIKSPVSGFIFDTLYVLGEWVPAGSPIAVILPPQNIKVRFFVPQESLGSLKIGQTVTIQVDGLDKGVPGTLSYISPSAEYTPPVIYSREWRTKLLYMLEARPKELIEHFHPGQPVNVLIGPS